MSVFVFGFFLSVSVDEKQDKVKGYHCKVNAIDNKNVGDVMIDDLADDTGNVADQDRKNKDHAFSFRRTGGKTFIDRDRPRYAKAGKHNEFKNLCHDLLLKTINLNCHPL